MPISYNNAPIIAPKCPVSSVREIEDVCLRYLASWKLWIMETWSGIEIIINEYILHEIAHYCEIYLQYERQLNNKFNNTIL